MRSRLTIALGLTLVAAAVAAQQSTTAPDRSRAPKPGPAPRLQPPSITKHSLANGLPVWTVERHAVPTVHATLVIKAGSGADPSDKYGLASLAAAMLTEGAGGRDALALADALEYLGAELDVRSSFDATRVELQVPSARLADALALMADVVQRPDFPHREIDRLREMRLTSLRTAKANPPEIAAAAFPLVVYGPAHRYGTGGIGTSTSLEALSADDLRAFHARYFRPENATLIVTGDVAQVTWRPVLDKVFGGWKSPAGTLVPVPVPIPPESNARTMAIVDKPGAAQSVIAIGGVGVPRTTPDYFALQLLNTILGGSFTSRLNQNLREQHGYTYGAGSAFDMRLEAGPFVAQAAVQTDKTAEAVTEFMKELERIREPIPDEELAKAKSYLALRFQGEFETSADLGRMFADLAIYGLPDDYYANYTDRIATLTSADLARVAKQYIRPDRFAIVVVGDRASIEPKLAQLQLGRTQVLAVDDVVR